MRSKKALLLSLIILLIVVAVFYFLEKSLSPNNNQPTPNQPPVATLSAGGWNAPVGAPQWGKRTKTSECKVQVAFPDPACTPGDLMKPLVTKNEICVSGYSSGVRNVPDSEKNAVYAEYGITSRSP